MVLASRGRGSITTFIKPSRNAEKTRESEAGEKIWKDLLLPIPTDLQFKVDVSPDARLDLVFVLFLVLVLRLDLSLFHFLFLNGFLFIYWSSF